MLVIAMVVNNQLFEINNKGVAIGKLETESDLKVGTPVFCNNRNATGIIRAFHEGLIFIEF